MRAALKLMNINLIGY